MKSLFLTPPMTQLNTAYPATAYITGFLRKEGYEVVQRDMAIEVLLSMLTTESIDTILDRVEDNYADFEDDELPDSIYHFLVHVDAYRRCTAPVLRFLQGKDPSLALRIVSRQFLPEGPTFENLNEMQEISENVLHQAFGDLGTQDKAKYLASLYIDDLVAVIHDGVDPNFEVSRYGERLAASNPSFDDLYETLHGNISFTEEHIRSLMDDYLAQESPDVVGITVPFPGNMLGALQIAKYCKEIKPDMPVLMGGGYVNTELRTLKDIRLFEYVDYILLDDGEQPLLSLLDYLQGKGTEADLVRTYHLKNKHLEKAELVYSNNKQLPDVPHKDIGTPCYDGLPLDKYLSLCEMLNPMHRIWSDGRWNKLTVAHGCYWSKCTFCDISLDYIGRYDEAGADIIVERIEQLITETGQTGFHFVDEAAPPKVLFAMAEKLIEKNLIITWWGNIRFEKTFTPEKCQLLADSGCIAISGGLEVASDRLLTLMKKGVSIEKVARVTRGFADAGILVHAYLMYGFPTQTAEETVDSLEVVRQLMFHGCFQSAYWHRFSATIHSPVGLQPDEYKITLHPNKNITFANNDVAFSDPENVDHDLLGEGLKKALYNYMHGLGYEQPMQFWFDEKTNQQVGGTRVKPDFIAQALA
ncbi:radical SAM protein [Cocleimonas sp. KMM 6892]|uniref:B12-binding domain-containing radical SAM protein n=1 Tax=unclassified Cocleimonas TaxID=2639732 RepID=UPI002DBBFC8D|nr:MULTISPECIES: radical SAM protein [unclassified Cocleimonas]MEB8434286.1 radical SAM protein [Cocleimonas sp. KMM 6892]MEC4717095.1 radical SAM protein [Cocleimonas sp. KMM 6895]MEC4746558.1 radical SAM protein [Cocleimonas sp. KMM 6896]